jgi:hypothetical protein
MSAVVIAGDTSGAITLQAPAVSGTTTVTIPATTGNFLLDTTTGVCRAWVNFNGTGTVAIGASYNVSSITDNGTGDYTVNMTNALSSVNYSITSNAAATGSTDFQSSIKVISSTSAFSIYTSNGTTLTDSSVVCVSVFR